ncbi:cytochrome c biogenesis protein [Nakamurella panacisegetis]|uniref:Cytochrome c biogenesis protein n=1 Tax=Nakamurella panacisegetis TaxID=1090615 RepID=A0A1H0NRK3_9ACTN|nr:cytochrome c biogenesis protein ResB [Nakamurella panacisegetis]SDO95397.1 cytochrome c biogenesis protein [Nakamurella panacisegetis]
MSSRDATHLAGGLAPDAGEVESTATRGPDVPDELKTPYRQGPVRGLLAFLRNIWRQLTSMRTALVLLFLLALASLPGALLPQWTLNQSKTAQYILDHGVWGRLLDKLGFFGVFGSPWYAAIYLLLFTSLIGCLLPRTWDFVGQIRMKPVATPRNLSRMPHSATIATTGDPAELAKTISAGLRGWRKIQRVEASGAITISAEKGFIREIGNLVFHFSLLGLLIAIAVGKLFGYEGSIILNADTGATSQFCSTTPSVYDNFRPGLLVDGTAMTPFCVSVDKFKATYTDSGQASTFDASIRYQAGAGLNTDTWSSRDLQVNDPLRIPGGQRLYLLGHGYSPMFTVTYAGGKTSTGIAPFQPADSTFTSQGVVKILDPPGYTGSAVLNHQLALVGVFAPSAFVHGGIMTSTFPAAEQPGVAVQVYRGDLGMDTGKAQSVFSIDQTQVDNGKLKKVKTANLAVGESTTLDDGTKITFTGYKEWVSLQTSYDPAEGWALIFAITLLAGLMTSLVIKRRRVWFRISPAPAGVAETDDPAPSGSGRTVVPGGHVSVEIGGLARTDQAGYGDEFGKLVALADAGAPRSS